MKAEYNHGDKCQQGQMPEDFENKNDNTQHNSIMRSIANRHEQIFKTDYIVGVAK